MGVHLHQLPTTSAMTVTYIQHVHTAKHSGAFLRLLAIWRGGVAKGIWKDLLFYLLLYTGISLGYRFGINSNEELKAGFERICVFFDRFGDYIPLGFILGFYVTQVVNRWWTQCMSVPWLDNLCLNLTSFMPGNNMKKTRRLITRWTMLSNILTLRRISSSVAKRFPTYEHFIDAGLMTERELKKLEKLDQLTEGLHATTWYPMQWAQVVLRRAREGGSISSDLLYGKLQSNIQDIIAMNGTLLMYAWVNIPLVYTQLVTIAVHIYFVVALLGRQYLTPTRYIGAAGDYVPVPPGTPGSVNLVGHDDSILDFYVPFFTILQFIFYFGWLKVAETLINPFGEDDDDIDVNYIIDRNFQISYIMVSADDEDEDVEDDPYGDSLPPASLPHTVSSLKTKEPAPVLPADDILISEIEEDKNKFVEISLPLPFQRRNSIRSCTSSQLGKQNHTAVDMIKTKFQNLKNKNQSDDYDLPVLNEKEKYEKENSTEGKTDNINGSIEPHDHQN